MIAGYGARPVFQYKFRPLANAGETVDGGFCVILYENGVVSFSIYGPAGNFQDELCFSLGGRILTYFGMLLRNATSWLDQAPEQMRSVNPCNYASSFAFDGYDPIMVYGINDMLTLPVGTPEGYFARHLYVLFEDIANLMVESGIYMTMDSFNWNAERIRPFRRQQTTQSRIQRIV